MLWTGMLMTHAAALKSRSWALVLKVEDGEKVSVHCHRVGCRPPRRHALEHQWKVHPFTSLADSVPVRGMYF